MFQHIHINVGCNGGFGENERTNNLVMHETTPNIDFGLFLSFFTTSQKFFDPHIPGIPNLLVSACHFWTFSVAAYHLS